MKRASHFQVTWPQQAFLRSQVWRPETWQNPVPDRPVMVKTLERPEASLEDLTAYYGPSYAEKLYG